MILLTTDLHYSDKPSEAYRFGIFHWIKKKVKKHNVTDLFVLGDLTTAKDKHSSKLVNKIIDGFVSLDMPIHILMGNHDYIDISTPFFKFLKSIPSVTFVTEPTVTYTVANEHGEGAACLMIPHVKDEWPDLKPYKGKIDYVLLHQTIEGAIAESGARLNGLNPGPIAALQARKVYSGDIHKPQQCGPVTYVGSPYNVRFGDDFKPRVLLVDWKSNTERDLHFPCPRKYVLKIRDTNQIENNKDLKAGDHVKVVLELAREEICEWPNYKRRVIETCKKMKLQMFGVELAKKPQIKRVRIESDTKADIRSDADIFKGFCKREKLSSTVREVGLELFKGTG